MNEKLSLLIRLQECDSMLAGLSAKKNSLPEKLQKIDEEFQRFKENISQSAMRYEKLKTQREENELKVKKISEAMARSKEKLLDVKTNKEYQAMLKEIETAETSLGGLESQIIILLEEMDELSVQVKQDQETLKQAEKNYLDDKKIIEEKLSSFDAESDEWNRKRSALQKNIPEDLLALYEKIRKRNQGVGVIPVWKAVCSGCHMNIPPQLYNELQRSSDLLSCPSCHRIMYFQAQDTSA
ncbi:MAG: C4-type zinc ribbon domain-containing protein [Smithellaceae bacterium]